MIIASTQTPKHHDNDMIVQTLKKWLQTSLRCYETTKDIGSTSSQFKYKIDTSNMQIATGQTESLTTLIFYSLVLDLRLTLRDKGPR